MVCCSGLCIASPWICGRRGLFSQSLSMKLTWGDYSLASYLWLEKGTHEDYIFTENRFKFISCCFLIIKSTRFQLQHFNLEHLEITLTELIMFIRTTTTKTIWHVCCKPSNKVEKCLLSICNLIQPTRAKITITATLWSMLCTILSRHT